MTKNVEAISEVVRNPKHTFRKPEGHTKKPLRHRYERRKVKEFLHVGDWLLAEET